MRSIFNTIKVRFNERKCAAAPAHVLLSKLCHGVDISQSSPKKTIRCRRRCRCNAAAILLVCERLKTFASFVARSVTRTQHELESVCTHAHEHEYEHAHSNSLHPHTYRRFGKLFRPECILIPNGWAQSRAPKNPILPAVSFDTHLSRVQTGVIMCGRPSTGI